MTTSRIEDWFTSGEEFAASLRSAESAASTEWEMEFVESLGERWDEYGLRAFLSESQYEVLVRLAGLET